MEKWENLSVAEVARRNLQNAPVNFFPIVCGKILIEHQQETQMGWREREAWQRNGQNLLENAVILKKSRSAQHWESWAQEPLPHMDWRWSCWPASWGGDMSHGQREPMSHVFHGGSFQNIMDRVKNDCIPHPVPFPLPVPSVGSGEKKPGPGKKEGWGECVSKFLLCSSLSYSNLISNWFMVFCFELAYFVSTSPVCLLPAAITGAFSPPLSPALTLKQLFCFMPLEEIKQLCGFSHWQGLKGTRIQ